MNQTRNFLTIFILLILIGQTGCILPFLGTKVPDKLVGTWTTGSSSNIIYQDTTTGGYSDPSGTQVMYKIKSNGSYEYASLTVQSMYSCTTKLMLYQTGYVRINGSQITFVPTGGKFTSQDNCNQRFNYEKPANLEQTNYKWNIEKDEYGEKICLQNGDVSGCAYKRE